MTVLRPETMDILRQTFQNNHQLDGATFLDNVATFARRGEADVLAVIEASGILSSSREGAEPGRPDTDLYLAAAGILLAEDSPKTRHLIRRWERALKITTTSVQRALSLARDAETAMLAVRLGADPLGPSSDAMSASQRPVNVLRQSIMMSLHEMTDAFLDHLSKSGRNPTLAIIDPDRMLKGWTSAKPIKHDELSFFRFLLERTDHDCTERLRAVYRAQPPDSWRRLIGRALVEYYATKPLPAEHTEKHKADLLALSMATLDAEDWIAIFGTRSGRGLCRFLADSSIYPQRRMVLSNALTASVAADAIRAHLEDGTACSLLQAAIDAGDEEVVKLLLAHGADPREKNAKGIDAFELVREKSSSSIGITTMLSAWRARQAVRGTITSTPSMLPRSAS